MQIQPSGGSTRSLEPRIVVADHLLSNIQLLQDVEHKIFTCLTIEQRLNAQLVSRAWRNALRGPALWRDMDLTIELSALDSWSPERYLRVLAAISRLAAGGLRTLRVDIPQVAWGPGDKAAEEARLCDALIAAVTANAVALTELHVGGWKTGSPVMSCALARRILEAGPALRSLDMRFVTETLSSDEEVAQLAFALSGEGLFAPLRVAAMTLYCPLRGLDSPALLASVARHSSLRKLSLDVIDGNYRAAVDLACAAARAGAVDFDAIVTHAEPFLLEAARLVAGFPLRTLGLAFDGSSETRCPAVFAGAVRGCRTLEELSLQCGVFPDDGDTGFFGAVTGHPTIHTLLLYYQGLPGDALALRMVLEAIAGVLAAPSALAHLELDETFLQEADLRIILGGLASPAARLETLELFFIEEDDHHHFLRADFVDRVMAPAVLACPSMRAVVVSSVEDQDEGLTEAVARLNARLADR